MEAISDAEYASGWASDAREASARQGRYQSKLEKRIKKLEKRVAKLEANAR